jgi:hypothetical protein
VDVGEDVFSGRAYDRRWDMSQTGKDMSETACVASVKRRVRAVSLKREVAAENVSREGRNRLEQGAEMTPKHQEIIDTALQAIQARERQYHRVSP